MLKTVIYIKRDKVNAENLCPIYIKVNVNFKSFTISTRKYISEARWKETNNLHQVLRVDKEKVIKDYLNHFIIKIERLYNQIQRNEEDLSILEFKNRLLGREEKNKVTEEKPTILSLFTFHNTHFEKLVNVGDRAQASLQKYERIKSLIKIFNMKNFGTEDILVENINNAYIFNLESFMKFESEYKGKVGIQNNSVVKYFKNIKTVFNYAIKMELILKNPFNIYDGKVKESEATYLTEVELQMIESRTFKIDRLNRVKDIFLFSCYTGYAPVDSMKLTRANIIQDANKNLWIKTNRQKTGTRANVPVLPPVLNIINKSAWGGDELLPKISNQKMNAYLKEIADLIGLQKNLTWYVARHTFATTVTLGNGIKIENVSAMLGHTTIKQTQHYAKVLDLNVGLDMEKLKRKYEGFAQEN
jgi:site-specific recombinase XerD